MKPPITVYPLKGRIPTKDGAGEPNGWLIPVWSAANPLPDAYRPDQVYVTAIAPRATKGPHLHKVRTGLFTCIAGEAYLIARPSDGVLLACISGGPTGTSRAGNSRTVGQRHRF